MNSVRRLIGVAAITLMSVSAIAGDSPVLDKILKSETIRVGMSGNQPPFNAHSRNGGLIGLEVDLARQLASAIGVEVTFVEKPFGDLLEALDKGDMDIVMSGVSITAKRATRFTFAGPYMMSGKSILTKSQTLAGARNAEAMNRADFSFAVLGNSTSEDFVQKYLPESKRVTVRDYDAGLTTLENPMTVEPIGIAVPKNDPQLVNLLDNILDAFERTGYLKELRKAWLQDGSWIAALP